MEFSDIAIRVEKGRKEGELMDKYLTVKEAGEILNIGKTKMYELVNQPDFPSVKMGKKILIPESELDKFMRRYLYKQYTY